MRRCAIALVLGALVFSLGGCAHPRELDAGELAMRETKIRQLLTSGNRALRAGTWEALDQAQAAYTLARELDANEARAIDGLGCVAWRKGNAKLAEFYFKRAIELNPEYDRPVAHLALVAEAHGHLRAAKELLARAVQLNPLNFRARNNLAAVQINADGDGESLAEAHRQLLRAFQLAGPEDPIVGGNLNLLQRRKGW